MKWRLPGEPGKFRARRTTCRQGQPHASRAEAARCDELHLQQRSGSITNLRAHPQPRYHLRVGDVEIGVYVADFVYVERSNGAQVVEDTKGFRTPAYRMKRLLMLALFGITVRETRPRAQRRPRRGAGR